MQDVLVIAALFIVDFLLGSIPFGLIISRVFYKTDLRQHGSGNIGTTNAIRTMGKVGGFSVFVLDFGKGLLAAALAGFVAFPLLAPGSAVTQNLLFGLAFLACTWGHIFSPWLGFKGGKGIAVAVGCLFIAFGPVGALLEIALFAVLVIATKYVSVGSIAAAATCPLFALYYFWGDWPAWLLCTIGACTVVWAHRANIARLRAGTENKVGQKKKKDQEAA